MYEMLVRRLAGPRQSIGRLLVAFMVIGFAAVTAAGIAAAIATARNQDHTRWVNHTYEVELAIANTSVLIEQGETTRRGYLLTRQPIYFDAYRRSLGDLPRALRSVGTLVRDNPRQQQNLARLRDALRDLQVQRERTVQLILAGDIAGATRAFTDDTATRRMATIRDIGTAMQQEERRLLAIRDHDQAASVRTFYATLGVAGLLLLFVAVASLLTVLHYTRDIAASRDALRTFADSLEALVAERTADLSRANEEIQRFAYIVSHDLRSPLVNVMGFTAELEAATGTIAALIDRVEERAPDLVSEDDRLAAREDLPEAIGFIRTSTQKMDRLINAILKLSREGRRTIAPERVDMAALIEGIGGSLQHLMTDRGAELIVEQPLPDIVSDRLAVEQIFSNLIENAVKYLDPARPGRIVVRGEATGARIAYEVEDNGRGIAAADHSRVFDLFRRSGTQDQPGEGIGLAHVRALAYRLGGVIDVRSELGRGATFRLSLPATLADLPTR